MIEWRSPTIRGITVPKTDLIVDPESVAEIRDLSDEFGLAMAYHAPQGGPWSFGILPLKTAVSRLQESIRRAASINARILTFHLGVATGNERHNTILQGARVVREAILHAQDLGICLCVENVFGEHSVATVEDCELLFEAANTPQLRFTLDTGHAHLCGCLHEMATAFPERLAFTHVHDNDLTQDQHRVPGRGTIDWKRLTAVLDQVNYMGTLNFELREDATLPELIRIWDNLTAPSTTRLD